MKGENCGHCVVHNAKILMEEVANQRETKEEKNEYNQTNRIQNNG